MASGGRAAALTQVWPSAALMLTALPGAAFAQAAPPMWATCSTCHSVEPGRSGLGPNLGGVVGRKAGSVPGYAYSPAMKTSRIVWTTAKLDAFLAKPQAVVKGTRMFYPGLTDRKARAAVISYLQGRR